MKHLCNEQETLFLHLSKQSWCLHICVSALCGPEAVLGSPALKYHFLEKRCYMLKRIKNSCGQMTNSPLLKQAFQLFFITMKCNCGLAKKILKTTTNAQKIFDHLFNRHNVRHYKVQLMVQALHIKDLSVFSFLQ